MFKDSRRFLSQVSYPHSSSHSNRITKHVEHSKMDAINIATVVGPNLVPLVEMLDPYEYLQNNAKIHAVLVYLISNYEGVFLESDTTKSVRLNIMTNSFQRYSCPRRVHCHTVALEQGYARKMGRVRSG